MANTVLNGTLLEAPSFVLSGFQTLSFYEVYLYLSIPSLFPRHYAPIIVGECSLARRTHALVLPDEVALGTALPAINIKIRLATKYPLHNTTRFYAARRREGERGNEFRSQIL